MITVDARTLVNSFVYEEFQAIDDWGKAEYADPFMVGRCRIDYQEVYATTGQERKLVATAIIFCYASATAPFLPFKARSKATFFGREHTVQKVVPVMEPYENQIWGYELEVI